MDRHSGLDPLGDVVEEGEELLRAVPFDRLADDLAGGDVERCQRQVAAFRLQSRVRVPAAPGFIGSGLRVRPDARIRGFSSTGMTTAWSGGQAQRPTTSRTFNSNLGSRETLKVFTWCGPRPLLFRMPCMVETAIPGRFASARTVQCRACSGGGDIASASAAFTFSPGIGFFPGGRVASWRSPPTPSAR